MSSTTHIPTSAGSQDENLENAATFEGQQTQQTDQKPTDSGINDDSKKDFATSLFWHFAGIASLPAAFIVRALAPKFLKGDDKEKAEMARTLGVGTGIGWATITTLFSTRDTFNAYNKVEAQINNAVGRSEHESLTFAETMRYVWIQLNPKNMLDSTLRETAQAEFTREMTTKYLKESIVAEQEVSEQTVTAQSNL